MLAFFSRYRSGLIRALLLMAIGLGIGFGPAFACAMTALAAGMLLPLFSPRPLISRSTIEITYFLFLLCAFSRLSQGTYELFAIRGVHTEIFDSLAKSFLEGHTDIPRSALGNEGFYYGGKTYSYFGVFPALLRIPLNYFWPHNFARWSTFLGLVAGSIAFFAGALFLNIALLHSSLRYSQRRVLFALSLLGVSFATPLYYILSDGSVYHECIAWGFAFSLSALVVVLDLLVRMEMGGTLTVRGLLYLSLCSSAAILSRFTFAMPLVGFCGIFSLSKLYVDYGSKPQLLKQSLRHTVQANLPLLLTLCGLAFYNYARFESAFAFLPLEYYGIYRGKDPIYVPPHFQWESLWNAGYYYFGRIQASYRESGSVLFPSSYAPWLFFPMENYREWCHCLTLTSMWLMAPTAAAVFYAVRERWILPCLIFALLLVQSIIVAGYFFITARYTVDFFPLFIWGFGWFLMRQNIGRHAPKISFAVFSIILPAIICYSIAANIFVTKEMFARRDHFLRPPYRESANGEIQAWIQIESGVKFLVESILSGNTLQRGFETTPESRQKIWGKS